MLCISPYAIVVCVCVSVCMPRLWTPGKRFEIETSFCLIAQKNTGHNVQEFDTNLITNSKMADKMAAVNHYNWLYLSHLLTDFIFN